jgi:hypothetical protein
MKVGVVPISHSESELPEIKGLKDFGTIITRTKLC